MSGHRTRVQQQQQQQEPRVALTIAKLLWLTPARVARVSQAVRVLAQHTWRTEMCVICCCNMDGQVHNKCNSIKRNKHTNTYREEELKEPGQEKGGKKAAAKRQTMKINYFLRQSETRKMCENG